MFIVMTTIFFQQIQETTKNENHATRLSSLVAELEETKQNLHKAREESQMVAHCLTSLSEELDKTKIELIQLKSQSSSKQLLDLEIEDLKFVENAPEAEIMIKSPLIKDGTELQTKRSVKFAKPPSLAQVINPDQEKILERHFSGDRESTHAKKKKKKKHLMPMIAAIFSKKKGYQDGASPKVPRTRILA